MVLGKKTFYEKVFEFINTQTLFKLFQHLKNTSLRFTGVFVIKSSNPDLGNTRKIWQRCRRLFFYELNTGVNEFSSSMQSFKRGSTLLWAFLKFCHFILNRTNTVDCGKS